MKYTRSYKKSVSHSYRRHRKASTCRGKSAKTCKKTKNCKIAKGSKRTFCRTKKTLTLVVTNIK